ncbi:hypothetical protein AOQ84DRAFT_378228 [Glonium stellatum]|uniref:Uncharacterized protein n=1 Tax=Glonium stellatum TaxID=574774 RepID=A0A8E2EXT8_9PEZI|nr:hypothetical protein AOQ84DRAFT_378228 [Glonium stellatum]
MTKNYPKSESKSGTKSRSVASQFTVIPATPPEINFRLEEPVVQPMEAVRIANMQDNLDKMNVMEEPIVHLADELPIRLTPRNVHNSISALDRFKSSIKPVILEKLDNLESSAHQPDDPQPLRLTPVLVGVLCFSLGVLLGVYVARWDNGGEAAVSTPGEVAESALQPWFGARLNAFLKGGKAE